MATKIPTTAFDLIREDVTLSEAMDLYAATMALAKFKTGRMRRRARYYGFFRRFPENTGWGVFGGTDYAAAWLDRFRFDGDLCAALEKIHGIGGNLLFPAEFIREIVGSSRVDLQACKLEYSIVSPK